ncbi:interleukin-17F-like [Alosa sapidissima]|uniref:interleukin-17F-like n=1 Tax=Alosa sapidissima TaxID=34773 RepID=UPI001C09F7F4|nr:interleukin-17F-like [Alosa sapidissima]
MSQLQLLGLFSLVLHLLCPCLGNPFTDRCVDKTFCTNSLEEYHAQLINLPNRINERSVAPWNYVEKVDLDRMPQVIFEAECLSSHSCRGVDSAFSLESIPITLKMPVLRRNPRCATFSLEFEPINIACICATSRHG